MAQKNPLDLPPICGRFRHPNKIGACGKCGWNEAMHIAQAAIRGRHESGVSDVEQTSDGE